MFYINVSDLQYYLILLIVMPISLSIHEASHGFVSYYLGDPTPKEQGRLTLNPLAHIDLVGMLMLFVFGFGWAKPVNVNPNYYSNKKYGMALTAFAGPISNFVLSFIATFAYVLCQQTSNMFLIQFTYALAVINIALGVFNLIPIPPLDGSKILEIILPDTIYFKVLKYEKFGLILLMVFLYSGLLVTPLMTIRDNIFNSFYNIASIFVH